MNGEAAADGTYLCLLIAQDKAGNSLKTDAIQIVVDNTPPDVAFKGEDSWADFASKKEFRFDINAADAIGIENWKLTISGREQPAP